MKVTLRMAIIPLNTGLVAILGVYGRFVYLLGVRFDSAQLHQF